MESSLLWAPIENHLCLMTTIIILNFAPVLDSKGRPLGKAAEVWDNVLVSFSKLSGWKSTKWGPRTDDKHGVVLVIGASSIYTQPNAVSSPFIVWNFMLPPNGFSFSRKEPLSQSSPLLPLSHLLASEPRVLNVPLFTAPEPREDQLGTATFDLELLFVPRNPHLYDDPTFIPLFRNLDTFVESQDDFGRSPSDFQIGHRGWLLDEVTFNSLPVHIIILHYPSLQSERRLKDPNVAHEGMPAHMDHPESLYQRYYLDTLAKLAAYGVERESLHFCLSLWRSDETLPIDN
ncbi:MAG: hypothetical protein Q9192_005839 [Flavoplaca navasiana]